MAVVQTLLSTRGGRPGSHRSATAAITRDDAEEVRADVDAAEVRDHRRYLPRVRELMSWVEAEIGAARHARKLVDDALALEREEGDVITERRPQFWTKIREMAAAHQPRRRHLLHTLQPAVEHWQEKFGFASHLTQELQQRVRGAPRAAPAPSIARDLR